ncbi:FecR domain-containing protein [Pseudomonas aeruginosa]|nr:FecR domain-containing protein [Pseudomonas aeruginosa]
MTTRIRASLLALPLLLPSFQAIAALPGMNLGQTSFLDGKALPGTLFQQFVNIYEADDFMDANGHRRPLDNRLRTLLATSHFAHISQHQLFGAYYGAEILVPVLLADPDFEPHAGSANGLGNLIVSPFILQWPQTELFGRPYWQRLSADYSTATGERRSIELVDGTRLQLNTDSAVDVCYDDGQRLILLARGEIFLASGADTQSPTHRPLRVRTAQGLFEALGTRFNVRLQDAATCLSVSEGSVRIDAFGARPLQAPVAEAGQSYRIAADGVRRLERPQMDAVAWADGLIVTRDMRLADFLAEVARYRNGYLGCAAEVADLRLSGVYRLDDTDKLLQVLARTLPVRLQRHTRWWVRVVAA